MLFIKLYILISICFSRPTDIQENSKSAGYIPFQVKSKANRHDRQVAVAGFTISNFVALFLIGPALLPELLGGLFAGIVSTATIVYVTRNNIGDAVRYQKLFGKIQIHINSVLSDKSASVLRARLKMISSNLYDQSNSYLAEMGIINGVLNTNATVMSPHQVDLSMKAVDNIMASANNIAFNGKYNTSEPDAFILFKNTERGLNKCLHTLDFNFAQGTQLLYDDQCAINSFNDKVFTMGSKKELLFYSPVGVMCVSTSRHGHLAIYSQDSPKCRNPSKITVRKTKAGNFAIYNGTAPACMDYIKGRGTYYPGLAIGKKCAHVDPITFDTRIPVPLAPGSLHTAQSYDELAVQMHYFVPLVSIHLAALKEIYLYGSMKGFAKEQFNTKKQQYLNWISSYLPIFEQYVGIAGFNATRQIETLYAFQKHLDSASLDPTVVHFNIDNE